MSGAYRGRAAGSSVRVEREEVAQLLQRRVDAPVMDEDTARFFPKMAVRQRIVDEHVAGHAVGALVDGHTGNDAGSGEMLGRPAHLLLRRPTAARQARQDDRVEMLDRADQPQGARRSEERRVGKAWGSTLNPRGLPYR